MSKRAKGDAEKAPPVKAGTPAPAVEEAPAPSGRLVLVEVRHAIAFGGVVVRPIVDDSGRPSGRPARVTPVRAVIPRTIAERYPAEQVQIVGVAEDDVAIGTLAAP